MKIRKFIKLSFIILIVITSNLNCKKDSNPEFQTLKTDSNSQDSNLEFAEYLRKYEDEKNVINFKKINNEFFWVTTIHGAGTTQEYYWKNLNNKLVPFFIFEYGGMDWDEPLEFTFISIKDNFTLKGFELESKIDLLKEKFIIDRN